MFMPHGLDEQIHVENEDEDVEDGNEDVEDGNEDVEDVEVIGDDTDIHGDLKFVEKDDIDEEVVDDEYTNHFGLEDWLIVSTK